MTPRAGFGRAGRRTVCGGPLPVDVAGTAPQAPLCFGEHVLGWPYSCTSVGGSQSTLSVPFSLSLSPRPGQGAAPGGGKQEQVGGRGWHRAGSSGPPPGPSAVTVPLVCGLVWVTRCPDVWLSLSPECACVVCACVCMCQCVCACVCAGRSPANPLNRTVHGWRKGVGALGLTVGAGTGVLCCRGPGATPLAVLGLH